MGIMDKLYCGFCYQDRATVKQVKEENGNNFFSVTCDFCEASGQHIAFSCSKLSSANNDIKAAERAIEQWKAVHVRP